MTFDFYTGSYAEEHEHGVCRYTYDPARGFARRAAWAGFVNPSFILPHPALPLLYTVEETSPEGRVRVWRLGEGAPEPVTSMPSGGGDPCHLALSGDGDWLFASNYQSGSLAAFRLDGNGVPTGEIVVRRHLGHGPNPARQASAHVHFALEGGRRLWVCDLGMDRIVRYRLTEAGPEPCGDDGIRLPAGSGPRHLARHAALPDHMYCVTELANTVAVLRRKGDGFEIVQTLSTLPGGFSGESAAAAVRMTDDAGCLLTSNRGHDSVAVYRVLGDGRLDGPVVSPCAAWPRDFLICGDDVIVGSQTGSELRAYRLDRQTLTLTDTGWRAPAHKPVCFAPIP